MIPRICILLCLITSFILKNIELFVIALAYLQLVCSSLPLHAVLYTILSFSFAIILIESSKSKGLRIIWIMRDFIVVSHLRSSMLG